MNDKDNTTKPNLAPCPFCGGKPVITDYRLQWGVSCDDCVITIFGDMAPEPTEPMSTEYWDGFYISAINKWNRRA